jgi:hypothetical protein
VKENENKLTHERLLEVLKYNSATGIFAWLVTRGRARKGGVAGYIGPHGDMSIRIDGTMYAALRLTHFYENGHWPAGAVIPADEDLDNARIANLRVVPEISTAELPKRRSDLTIELIRKLSFYEGGRLFWACHCHQAHIRFGMEAGRMSSQGYRVIMIAGIEYPAHRIAWAHHHGKWPKNETDHKNGIRNDNRIENLRDATYSQNCANRKIDERNKTGVKGIYVRGDNGTFRVKCNRKNIGSFKTIQEAIIARFEAEKRCQGEFALRQRH